VPQAKRPTQKNIEKIFLVGAPGMWWIFWWTLGEGYTASPVGLYYHPPSSTQPKHRKPANPHSDMNIRIQSLQPFNCWATALSLAASLALAGGLQASTVTETFDSAASTAANGWTGSGNTANNNSYGWSDTQNVPGDAQGEAGGVFARTSAFAYFADTNGGTLTRTDTLNMSGKFKLLNDNYDGSFRLGFFNTADVGENFVGISFVEPEGGTGDPFRGYAVVGGTGGAGTGIIPLTQTVTITFDLTWTPAVEEDGSGTLTGTITVPDPDFPEEDPDITNVNVAVAAGEGTFNAFGLASGGSNNNQNQKTAGCYFDDLTYTAVAPTTYTITYNGNGNDSGTVPDPQVKTENQALTLATNSGNLAKTGFVFIGWNTEADGNGDSYAAGATYTANGDATLYAQWGLPYTITYNGNGNTSGTAPDPQVAAQDVPTTLATNSGALAKTGFTFFGWNTEADGSGTNYAAGASYTDNTDVTLYARWVTATRTWIQTVAGTQLWGTTTNWQDGLNSTAAGDTVNFTADLAGSQNITMGSTRTVGTLNLGLSGNTFRYNFSNVGWILKANAGDTLGTATINVNNDVSSGEEHILQGGIQMAVENVNLNINSAGGELMFVRNFTDNDGDATRSPTMTLSAVAGASIFEFRNTTSTTSRNQWGKLVVNQHAIFRNRDATDAGGGTATDRSLGIVLSSYLADAITLNGGTLQTGLNLNYNISTNRGITLGALGGTLDANGTSKAWTVDSVITGSGGLTLSGAGSVTLNAENTYDGDTIVNDGTLIVSGGNAIPDSGKLVINTGGKVNPSGTTETVATLFFGAEQQIAGTWGATGSGATNINDTYFTGTGVVSVATGPTLANTYSTWATTNGAGANLNDDHDNDGVDNGVEFFLVGPTGNSTGFTALPGVVTTAGVRSITWTKAADYPGVYGTDFRVETSETLATDSWTTETEGGNVTITGNDVTFTFPAGPTKKFARLVVTGP
jgi:autotransporter-associated beta strand protein